MNQTRTRDDVLILICRILVCATFLGRAWQHLQWDAPLRALLWNQGLLKPVITGFLGIPWQDWVGNLSVDAGIQGSIRMMGGFYLICAIVTLTVKAEQRIQQRILMVGSGMLLALSGLYYMEQYYRIGQLFEYSLQWSAPLFLIAALRGGLHHPRFALALKGAIALTFIGHGLYAAGIYPMPGHFVTMLMNGLGLSEDLARTTLVCAGYVDFAVAAFIFVPGIDKAALTWTVIWGFATAFARVIAYYDATNILGWLDAWAYQTVYRLAHGGMPLLMLLLVIGATRKVQTQPTPQIKLATA